MAIDGHVATPVDRWVETKADADEATARTVTRGLRGAILYSNDVYQIGSTKHSERQEIKGDDVVMMRHSFDGIGDRKSVV